MIPDWHSLWRREPALIPEGGEIVDAIDPDRPDHSPWGKIPKEDFDRFTAAMARDAAVRWLENQDGWIGGIILWWDRNKLEWTVGRHNGHSDFDEYGKGKTKDEALFAACFDRLSASDAAKAKERTSP